MQIISQVFSACMSPMAIVDSKEGALRPVLVLSVLWFHDVEYDGDPVLVVVPHQALVGVGCVRPHYAVPLHAALGGLVVGDHNPGAWLQRQLPAFVVFLRLVYHLVDV